MYYNRNFILCAFSKVYYILMDGYSIFSTISENSTLNKRSPSLDSFSQCQYNFPHGYFNPLEKELEARISAHKGMQNKHSDCKYPKVKETKGCNYPIRKISYHPYDIIDCDEEENTDCQSHSLKSPKKLPTLNQNREPHRSFIQYVPPGKKNKKISKGTRVLSLNYKLYRRCDFCRKNKLACNNDSPCSNCLNYNNEECTYSHKNQYK